MFFFRIAQGATGGDIFVTTRADSEPAVVRASQSRLAGEYGFERPAAIKMSADRETLFLASNRVGTLGNLDIWVSTRDKSDKP